MINILQLFEPRYARFQIDTKRVYKNLNVIRSPLEINGKPRLMQKSEICFAPFFFDCVLKIDLNKCVTDFILSQLSQFTGH